VEKKKMMTVNGEDVILMHKMTTTTTNENLTGGFLLMDDADADADADHDKAAAHCPPPPRSPAYPTSSWTTLSAGGISLSSVVLLNLVAVLWGTQHAVIKSVLMVDDTTTTAAVDPSVFTLVRFGLAAVMATLGAALTLDPRRSTTSHATTTAPTDIRTTLSWGAEMGLWMFLGFAFQAIGLQFTTASKSGFLLYLNVKLVPILAFGLLGRSISFGTLGSAATAFFGTALLATNGDVANAQLNVGDAWSVAAATASAMFILRLESASKNTSNHPQWFNASCLWMVTILAGLWTLLSSDSSSSYHNTIFEQISVLVQDHAIQLLYLSGVTTALANYLQTIAQREVPAERASLFYAMDPVYGAAFSHLLLGENLESPAAWIGAGLIVVAAATNAIVDGKQDTKDNGSDEMKDES
jgi:drug/metabolite transporter (DMT)-like permease